MEGKSVWFGMTVTVHKIHVAQISQTEGELSIYLLLLFIAFAGKNKAGEGGSVALYLYLHPTCPSEGTEKHCIKKKKKKKEKTQNPAAASPLILK